MKGGHEAPKEHGRFYHWLDRGLPVSEFMERHITGYPTPRSLNYLWNFGSLAGFFITLQIITGFFLMSQYRGDATTAFASMQQIMRDVDWGWMIRDLHAVGASFAFAVIYAHTIRGMWYGSYKEPRRLLWHIGLLILLATMLAGFTGYLLPWGQMSYWAAQVITDLFSAIPLIGTAIVEWIRGGFVVGNPTLTRMFAIHAVLVPLLLLILIVLHLSALHKHGSNNPTGVEVDKKSPQEVTPFHPLHTAKDAWFTLFTFLFFFAFVFFAPDFFSNPDNYTEANPLVTPSEIVPEWYFLPFFAILRAIPNKLLGVIAFATSIGIYFFLPMLDRVRTRRALSRPIYKWMLLVFMVDLYLLGWVAAYPPLGPYLLVARIATAYYFIFFLSLPFISRIERRMLGEEQDSAMGRHKVPT